MASASPAAAASTAACTVGHGLDCVPSLLPALYDPSTYCTLPPPPLGTEGNAPAPHAATSWHALSPGTASCPAPHGTAGRIGSQPTSASCLNPFAQPSAGTPGFWQLPLARVTSPA